MNFLPTFSTNDCFILQGSLCLKGFVFLLGLWLRVKPELFFGLKKVAPTLTLVKEDINTNSKRRGFLAL